MERDHGAIVLTIDTLKYCASVRKEFWSTEQRSNPNLLEDDEWVLEAVDNGKYHIVHRGSPENGTVKELGVQFLKLSELKIPDRNIY